MDYFRIVKMYYNYIKSDGTRMYSKEQVAIFVQCGSITKENYKEITGEDYPEPTQTK